MNQFHKLFRWAWSVIVVCSLAFAMGGCDGDDGAQGPQGPTGPTGPIGPEGPEGPGAAIVPLESCGVCHDDGSFASAAVAHALDPIETVSNVNIAVAANAQDLEVTFTLEADGALALNYDQVQRGYRNPGDFEFDICNAPSRSDPCDPNSLALTNNGDGTYLITVFGGAAEAANDNRYMFRVGVAGEGATRVYFYNDFPASPFEPLIVSAAACNACHGPERMSGIHGGSYAAADGAEPCLICHGSDRDDGAGGVESVPTLAYVVHGYHSSVESWKDPVEEILPHITYPTYMNNCSVCHAQPAELAAANAMPVVAGACFTCHGDADGIPFDGTAAVVHENITGGCETCHAGQIPLIPQTVADAHNGSTTGRGGVIWDGVDTSVTEGALFDWQIIDVVDDGVNLEISWTADYNGLPVDPCNDDLAAGPTFHAAGDGNLSILRNYAQGDDFILGMSTSSPGQALSVNVTVDNTECAVAGIAVTTVPVDDVTAERGIIALQGKPRTPSPADPTVGQRVRAKTPTYEWVVGDGAPFDPPRADLVDSGLCLNCHVGSMYQHGGNRVDNVGMCILCHNSASNEKNVRVGMGVDASEAYDGRVGQTFEMKTMLHRIHSANYDWNPERGIEEYNPPYLVYRGRGIYAFAGAGEVPPNWDAGGTAGCTPEEVSRGERDVFGSDPTSSTSCQPHNYHNPTYPRSLNECAACHAAAAPGQRNQTAAMASTQDAGGTVWENQLDDVLQGAATTTCITCHAGGAAKGHAYQNSWQPQEFENGRQDIIDAVN